MHHPLQPPLEREGRPLHDPVGQQDEGPGPGQQPAGHRIPLAGEHPQRQPAVVQHHLAPAVGGGPDRRDMAGARIRQLAGRRVEAQEGARHEQAGTQRHQQVVDPGEDLSRIGGDTGDGAQPDADLTHEGGGLHVMALHVTDDDADRPTRHHEGVVPVAADVQPGTGRDVARRGPQPRHHRQLDRQDVALERHGQFHPDLLEFDPLEHLAGELHQGLRQLVVPWFRAGVTPRCHTRSGKSVRP